MQHLPCKPSLFIISSTLSALVLVPALMAAELMDYHHHHSDHDNDNQINHTPTSTRLKLFGFSVSEDEEVDSSLNTAKPLSDSPDSSPGAGDRKYECQYCC